MSTRYLSCAETAKLIRAALKSSFPGVKFSVRSHTYAGGASIDVKWTDGPNVSDCERVAKRYAGATFDGMTDMKTYHRDLLSTDDGAEVVHFGADFVFCTREHSTGFLASLEADAVPLGSSHGSQCRYCAHHFTSGWLIPEIDRAWGCSPEHAAIAAAQHVSA